MRVVVMVQSMRTVSPSNAGDDAARQLRLEIGVEVVVREMREIRPLGPNLRGGGNGLRNAEVRRVLGAEQRVDHQHARAPQQRDAPPAGATSRR